MAPDARYHRGPRAAAIDLVAGRRRRRPRRGDRAVRARTRIADATIMTFNERAARVIPGGAHTYSKGRDQFPANAPQAFVRGKGARVRDLDGREFVDWGMGINNVLIGHAE